VLDAIGLSGSTVEILSAIGAFGGWLFAVFGLLAYTIGAAAFAFGRYPEFWRSLLPINGAAAVLGVAVLWLTPAMTGQGLAALLVGLTAGYAAAHTRFSRSRLVPFALPAVFLIVDTLSEVRLGVVLAGVILGLSLGAKRLWARPPPVSSSPSGV
jgi:hypothetical protein